MLNVVDTKVIGGVGVISDNVASSKVTFGVAFAELLAARFVAFESVVVLVVIKVVVPT